MAVRDMKTGDQMQISTGSCAIGGNGPGVWVEIRFREEEDDPYAADSTLNRAEWTQLIEILLDAGEENGWSYGE